MEGWFRKVMGNMAWLWDRLGFGTGSDWFGVHMDQVYFCSYASGSCFWVKRTLVLSPGQIKWPLDFIVSSISGRVVVYAPCNGDRQTALAGIS